MSFTYVQKIPSVNEIFEMVPLSKELKTVKSMRDKEILSVFEGNSNKFLLIIGPCSAHDEDSVCDYISRLAYVQEKVKDKLLLIPRIYTNKPRTTGEGYKGMMHQPDHQKEPNLVEGLKAIRRMHIRALRESHLPAADEMLYPGNYPYLEDVLSYSAIGARSVENQQHRLTVSGLDTPVGMKNPTSGDIEVMLNSIQAAQLSHAFIYNGYEVKTSGNPLAHAILRGAVNQHGQCIANYHYEELMRTAELYSNRSLANPALIVDTNHANSNKMYREQPRIAMEIMRSKKHNAILHKMVKGLMIESFIGEGAQKANENEYGKSITDACLGWDSTERLINDIAYIL
ncbi:MAG TPA: 3-deoxy-7-phosphoheptulonate synthase [Candidatus Margulisbacteria bacterium]|nr:3-deoxy-7-phosphoheptulonate synthase [Candidatus Margulisiibacteriota bacterium]